MSLLLLPRQGFKYPRDDLELLIFLLPPPDIAAVSCYTQFMSVLGVEPRASPMLSELSTDELQLSPLVCF